MASGGVSLDEIDERLLTLLRDDARQTIAQLAKELGIGEIAQMAAAGLDLGEGMPEEVEGGLEEADTPGIGWSILALVTSCLVL